MIQDPLTTLEQFEATKRGLKPGEHLNPNIIEPYLALFARAVVTPDQVENPRMSYRPQSVRRAMLGRLGKLFDMPTLELRWDLKIAIDLVMQEQEQIEQQERAEQVALLERMHEL